MAAPKIGLTKRQLLALPKLKAPILPPQTEEYIFSMSASVEKTDTATIVHATLFWAKSRQPIAEIFLNSLEKCDLTYDISTGEWSRACIGNFIYSHLPHDGGVYWYSYHSTTYNDEIPDEVHSALLMCGRMNVPLVKLVEKEQASFRGDLLQVRNQRKQEKIDAVMNQAKPLTAAFLNFIEQTFRKHYTYLCYERKERNTTKVRCTYCGTVSEILSSKIKHNQIAACPHCHTRATYICASRYKYTKEDADHIILVDKIPGGLLYRDFTVIQTTFQSLGEKKIEYSEQARTFCDFSTMLNTCYEETWHHSLRRYEWRYETNKAYWYQDAFRPGHVYTASLRAALQNTGFKYSAIEKAAAYGLWHDGALTEYLRIWKDEPRFEYLAKIGLTNICKEWFMGNSYRSTRSLFCNNSNNILRALCITSADLSILRRLNPTFEELEVYRYFRSRSVDVHTCVKVLKKMRILDIDASTAQSNAVPVNTVIRVIMSYAEQQQKKHGTQPRDLVRDYHDYYGELILLGRNLDDTSNLYPEHFRERHKQLTAEVKVEHDFAVNNGIVRRYESERALFECKGKNYIVLLPKDAAEIAAEGKALTHCVATYAEKHAKGLTTILFVRRADFPDEPYCTAEICNGKLRQLRTAHNAAPTEDITKFFDRYIKKLSLRLDEQMNKEIQERIAV